ncbi:MAG: glucan biosynthesis protein G [Burkholderiales bacterium]|nr:glucan biosynthesis protein G [Burkholderiales bacterium]
MRAPAVLALPLSLPTRVRGLSRGLFALALLAAAGAAQAFGFDAVAARAQAAAAAPYAAHDAALPAELAALSYDQYRDIRYRPDHALWHGEQLPFEVQFFHAGTAQNEPVRVAEVDARGVVHPLRFDRSDFDYGANHLHPADWGELGVAGLRIHYALNRPDYKDELIVFLGASYFRALGGGQGYGLSARALALDTPQAEEFPRLTAFWIEKPAPQAKSIVILARLDSKRAAGAYRFEVFPGVETRIEVRARLFLRAGVTTLGLAPLTSMFLSGPNQPRAGDFRPAVHDSDGLMIAGGDGEWLWRPLIDPAQPLTTSVALTSLRGFGLMQRERRFAAYEDAEARYERRPSVWITPHGDWGPGRVELVQLPTADETNDNIVAYWVPAQAPAPGAALDIAYEMRWQGAQQQRPPGAWVTQTRVGSGYWTLAPGEQQYVVDFEGPALAALAPDAKVRAVVSAAHARIVETNVFRVEATGAWRMTLRVAPDAAGAPAELRAFLQHDQDTLSETWTCVIPHP